MDIDRRSFFKTLGVAGMTLAAGSGNETNAMDPDKIEFRGVLYDSTRCAGCQQCELTCAEAHGFPAPEGVPESGKIRTTSETQRTVINAYATANGDIYTKTQCMHCNEPACAAACLTRAMYKTKEGPVIWRGDKCMGCRYCMVSCPFDIPKFEYHSANPKIQKCDMCYDRQQEGKVPACVETCPAEALKFGTRRELLTEARKRINDNPESYVDSIYGETVAGGTGFMYVGPVPFNEVGLRTDLQNSSYPALSKGFLYSVPAVFVLLPSLLLGIHEATKTNQPNTTENE